MMMKIIKIIKLKIKKSSLVMILNQIKNELNKKILKVKVKERENNEDLKAEPAKKGRKKADAEG